MSKSICKLISTTILLVLLALVSCKETKTIETTHEVSSLPGISIDQEGEILDLMKEYKVMGVGLGVIQNGALTQTAYYGEQGPGIPVSNKTMFNVASTTKAVTAEVFLRLAAKGEVDLDEPISDYYVYADIADDPRHKLLTPRMILTHKSGFLNWPWLSQDRKLAFVNDPGTTFGYSGVGFYILGRFLEEKLWTTFPHLVQETIFKPLEMKNVSIVREDWFKDQCPIPVNRDGNYIEPYNHGVGYTNPADDLHVSVESFAKFLISSMSNDGLTEELIKIREEVHTDLSKDEIMGTHDADSDEFFPKKYGYGIGWMVFDYGDGNKNLQHGGNDEGEASMAYFHTKTKNGLIVFCNGGNSLFMLPKIVSILDKEEKYTPVYTHSFKKFLAKKEN